MKIQPRAISSFVIGYLTVLTIATLAAYSSIGGSEILRWDDNVYLNSELVQSLAFDNLLAMLYTPHHNNWHPLTTLSFAIENTLWGQNAIYAKIVNICLHLLNSFLFYLLGFRLLLLATARDEATQPKGLSRIYFDERDRFAQLASLFAATLFALHPQHVESVAWISERKGLLCALFYLAALIWYLRTESGHGGTRSYLTAVFTLLALMSKPMAVSLPIAMMLLDVYPLKKLKRLEFSIANLQILLRGKFLYLLMVLASVSVTLLFQEPQSEAVLGYLPRLINACAAYLSYLVAIIYPLNLSPFYPFLGFSLEPSMVSLVPVTMFAGLVTAAVYFQVRKDIRLPLVILGFYVIALLPVIGVVKVGLQAMADRYAYLPTIGFYLLLGVGVYTLLTLVNTRWQRHLTGAGLILICAYLGLTTHEHTRHWRSDVLMWQRVIDVFPQNASIAYVNLAAAYHARGGKDADQIEPLIVKALEIDPNLPYNLKAAANFYGLQGQEEKALGLLLRIIEAAPYNYWARSQAGDIYFKREDFATAGDHYLAALQLGEKSEKVIFRLAWIDVKFQRYRDALAKLDLLTSAQMQDRKAALTAEIQQALEDN